MERSRAHGWVFGIGGSSSSTDRKNQLAGYGDLSNLYNVGLSGGQQSQATGQADLGQASNYWSQLLSGNRSTISNALSPAINSITGQANQDKQQQAAMGTSRSGGTNAANQQLQQQTQGQISNLINAAPAQAASQMTNIGSTELGNASNLLGLGSNAASSLTGAASNSYQTTSANNQAQGAALASLIFG